MEASSDLLCLEQKRVLVLNGSFEPIRIVSWQRAILMLLGQKIEVLESYDVFVRSVSCSFALPSVIKMKRYVRPHRAIKRVKFSRQHVFLRDDHCCQYCVKKFPIKQLTLDHVVPLVRGGTTTWANIVTSCVECNQRKGAHSPSEVGMVLCRPPREPQSDFLPDLLFYKTSLPLSWKVFLSETQLSFCEALTG
jgi:5-methylcytosine-specific restriction endonuclease McrA